MGQNWGQHSGNEDCVMRYDCSEAFTSGGDRQYCLIWEGQEPVGQGLCTSPDGTGVNEIGRKPISRYSESSNGRGACADKICVNDLYH
jgi:hypothetical protein